MGVDIRLSSACSWSRYAHTTFNTRQSILTSILSVVFLRHVPVHALPFSGFQFSTITCVRSIVVHSSCVGDLLRVIGEWHLRLHAPPYPAHHVTPATSRLRHGISKSPDFPRLLRCTLQQIASKQSATTVRSLTSGSASCY